MVVMSPGGWTLSLPVLFGALLSACSCSGAHTTGDTLGSEGEVGGGRFGVFSVYPGARPLCNEHVSGSDNSGGSMHITWRSFAVREDPAEVALYYRSRHPEMVEKGESELTLRTSNQRVLSVHAAEARYPSCDEKPGPAEPTVIIVSQATGGRGSP
jgi:hypothetical protein